MAILTTVKEKVSTGLGKVADAGGNIVAKASSLSSAQLKNIEEKRHEFMCEKPDTDPEGIRRMLGSYAIEAYEAYLPLITRIYEPLKLKIENESIDKANLQNRIRYFEITKWVSDPTEDSLEKLVNVYQVVSRENCNIALIYDRKKAGCRIYLAILNTDAEGQPQQASTLTKRVKDAINGNFPGVEIKENIETKANKEKNKNDNKYGIGIPECLRNIDKHYSVAAVSNIAAEKKQDFSMQRMEKLLDGICPKGAKDEYIIVLLATPVMEQLEQKNKLSELYSKLAPYAGWQTNFTLSESHTEGSHATVGVNLGASAGRRSAKEDLHIQEDSYGKRDLDIKRNLRDEYKKEFSQTMKKIRAGIDASISASVEVQAGIPLAIQEKIKAEISAKIDAEIEKALIKQKGIDIHNIEEKVHEKFKSKTTRDLHQTGKRGIDLGLNFGASFSRSSDVSVTLGKNEGMTQTFTNYGIKYTLETIEKQIKRLDESSSLGMWDFSAYFLSPNPIIANNAAHMYLALTQGDTSYMSQSAVNLWVNSNSKDLDKNGCVLEYIKRLQHPEFQLREVDAEGNPLDDEWLMYPPHVNTTVGLTGRELARALNFPKKSISGVPVIECAAFGREVHKFEGFDSNSKEINVGHVYHMHHQETEDVKLDINSLTSHTFITGSTGTGKSNTVYQLLSKIKDEKIPYLVIEPAKGEYKEWFGSDDCRVFGINGNETELLYINPFSFPKNIHVLEHIDRLVEILNACWPMYAAMPAVLKDAIERSYVNKGWNLQKSVSSFGEENIFPTFMDLLVTLPEVMEDSSYSGDTKSDYSGALITRIKSLTNGLNGQLLCSGKEIPENELFEKNVIVDLSRVGAGETKSFFMGILIMKLQEYHMGKTEKREEGLQHLTIIEEAHNLLRKTSMDQSQESSNLQGKSVEMLTNSIAEMRSYGEGFVIVDQAPGLLDESVIRNTNTKIILRLPDANDREIVGRAATLNDEQIKEIAKLPCGVAVVYQNNWVEAVLCHYDKYTEKKSYEKVNDNGGEQTPYDMFCKYVFSKDGFDSLKDEDVDSILKWIENSKYALGTKRIMRKAVVNKMLTEREKQLIAYNVFEGKTIAKLLTSALTEQEGIKKADYFLESNMEINDVEEIQLIRNMIIQAMVSHNIESDLAKRYIDYTEKIR
ncbi:MAG TPA: ATP-binding protein [Lachnospiraceae bacterium]|nr:ATP-binding protein [Lachnospiraceae bacterium]